MIYTVQNNASVVTAGVLRTGLLRVTDTNGYATYYAPTALSDGSSQLGGCIDIEDSARRQAAQTFLTYQLVQSSSIQVQRLSNGIMEVWQPDALCSNQRASFNRDVRCGFWPEQLRCRGQRISLRAQLLNPTQD